jgi:hypothetical protein
MFSLAHALPSPTSAEGYPSLFGRFSCMLFLSVHGFLDYAGPNQPLAIHAAVVLPSSYRNGVGILDQRLFEAQ